ncbi:hypothetical protein HID58_095792 [Brassica napus]|uniref:Terpene synthase metal-binding domain-containing protein n=1 Tax=Brassica napus TaxID=3708 RepID=A0ABQ7X2C2_BRANA|nr:hypothetical protein HID58_095792 [Brassica napus]
MVQGGRHCIKVATLLQTHNHRKSFLDTSGVLRSTTLTCKDYVDSMTHSTDMRLFLRLKILANSLERCTPDHAMDNEPEYMKAFKAAVKAYFEHAKWAHAAHLPSFEEYMEVAEVEIGVPRLVKSISVRGRLMNDITGFEDDMSRGQITNAVNCYMKQYGVTKQDALRELHKMVADTDNITNEELLTTAGVSSLVLKTVMGLAQSITVCYNGCEGYTRPEGKIKEYMTSMYVDQIRL